MTKNEIRKLQERMKTLYDELTSRILAEETKLAEWGFRVETWINGNGYQLGYARFGDNWHIVVKETRTIKVDGEEKEEERIKRLTSAAREIRYSAIKKFPELCEAVFNQTLEIADKLEKILTSEEHDA